MTTYAIKQINMTDDVYNTINSGVDQKLNKAYFDSRMGNVDGAVEMGLYHVVALIDANDLDEVFEIGNIGPEDSIKRFSPMCSISVGDIIIDTDTMIEYSVANMGFKELKKD